MRYVLCVVAAVAGYVLAAGAAVAAEDGAAIAKKGAPGVAACESCHTGTGEFPLLAGQFQDYLARQINDFRAGKRTNPVMAPVAKALTPAQIAAVTTWYSEQPRRKAPAAAPLAAELMEKARLATINGIPEADVFPCEKCHGAKTAGGDFVGLAGQNPTYMMNQIKAFRDGKRDNDPYNMMGGISKRIPDDLLPAILAYIAAQP